MNDPLTMSVMHGTGEGLNKLGSGPRRYGIACNGLGERIARYQLHCEVLSAVGLADFVDLHNIRVLEPSNYSGLVSVSDVLRRFISGNNFERHKPTE